MLISNQNRLAEFCAALRETAGASGAPLAFDTEFMSEKRYYARLCLVQVFMPATHGHFGSLEAAIDPFGLDLKPLLALLADPNIQKIVHSGSADLQILWDGFNCATKNVFDTQIAAAFLGFGHQIGYADLVRKITGVGLSKSLQYSDWAARPLSAEQIDYALDDVRHLPPIVADLKAQLVKRGRFEWAKAEFGRAETKAQQTHSDATLYRKLNLSGLNRKALAILRETAILREEIAREMDKPASFIMPDLAMTQMAKTPPANAAALRAIRGMPHLSHDQARQFVEAVERALALKSQDWPEASSGERPDPRLDAIVALLGVVAGARATLHDVSRTYLAPRDPVMALADWWLQSKDQKARGEDVEKPDLALLKDWRAELLGNDLLRLLDGELVVKMDAATGLPILQEVSV